MNGPNADKNGNQKPATRTNGRWWRRSLFALLVAVLVLPGYVVYEEIRSRRPGVTVDNFRRLKLGMTEKEIESLFGPKAREKSNVAWEGLPELTYNPKTLTWVGEGLSIDIDLNQQGRATAIRDFWQWPGPPKDTVFDKIRRWIGSK